MLNLSETNSCCGVGELDGCSTFVKDVNFYEFFISGVENEGWEKYKCLFFADKAEKESGGTRLAAFLTKRRFGRLVPMRPFLGKHGYNLRAWLWTPNQKFHTFINQLEHTRVVVQNVDTW